MEDRRLQVLASIGTRLAIGAYPLFFVLVFGWAYGKEAFDLASAASNWANYLNVLLLSGFVLVPPAVARLRATPAREDGAAVRDHIALARVLLAVGVVAAIVLWALVDRAFPALAAQGNAVLRTWFMLLAILALAQIPLTLWLGIAQAAGRYRTAFLAVAVARGAALVVVAGGARAGADPTTMLAAAVALIVAAQWTLMRATRETLRTIDARILAERGDARAVLRKNLSAGAVVLVGTLVTIVPVSIVGRLLPQEVGHAHAIVSLSNAVGAIIVAAFFPLSLTLSEHAGEPAALRRYCLRVARGALAITGVLIAAAWIAYPACSAITPACRADLFGVGSLVVLGAGLRLGSLGAYHAGLSMGHPHYAMLSVATEGVAVVALTAWLLGPWMLYALGIAFVAGGMLRLGVAFAAELPLLAGHVR